jgi:hypothetical protein
VFKVTQASSLASGIPDRLEVCATAQFEPDLNQ